jgi:Flp pilus assembly protein TadG
MDLFDFLSHAGDNAAALINNAGNNLTSTLQNFSNNTAAVQINDSKNGNNFGSVTDKIIKNALGTVDGAVKTVDHTANNLIEHPESIRAITDAVTSIGTGGIGGALGGLTGGSTGKVDTKNNTDNKKDEPDLLAKWGLPAAIVTVITVFLAFLFKNKK